MNTVHNLQSSSYEQLDHIHSPLQNAENQIKNITKENLDICAVFTVQGYLLSKTQDDFLNTFAYTKQ